MFISLNNKCKACDSGPLYLYRNNISQEIQDGIQTMCWLCCGLRQTWRNVTHSNSNAADKLLLRLKHVTVFHLSTEVRQTSDQPACLITLFATISI